MVDVGDTRSCAGTGEDGDEDEGTVEDVGVVGGTINCAGTGGDVKSCIENEGKMSLSHGFCSCHDDSDLFNSD